MTLDNLHWSILQALQENARLSLADIGRRVGLSAPAVAERIQRMEEEGLIKGYHAAIDLEKAGYPFQAIISMRVHSGKLNAFLKQIEQMPEIRECYRVTGEDCLFIKVAVKNPSALEGIISGFAAYGETTTSVILSSAVAFKVIRD